MAKAPFDARLLRRYRNDGSAVFHSTEFSTAVPCQGMPRPKAKRERPFLGAWGYSPNEPFFAAQKKSSSLLLFCSQQTFFGRPL